MAKKSEDKEMLKIENGFMRILDDKTAEITSRIIMKMNNLTEEDLK